MTKNINDKWRIGILLNNGQRESSNFSSKEQCEEWLLKQLEIKKIKTSLIVNLANITERYFEHWT